MSCNLSDLPLEILENILDLSPSSDHDFISLYLTCKTLSEKLRYSKRNRWRRICRQMNPLVTNRQEIKSHIMYDLVYAHKNI